MRHLVVLSVVLAAGFVAATASVSAERAVVCGSYLNVPREETPLASRDGRVLVWTRTDFRGPTTTVYVSAPDGSRVRRILPGRILVDWLAIAPDGSEVLVGTHVRIRAFWFLASTTAPNVRSVVEAEMRDIRRRWRTPEWSPDGRLVEAGPDGVWVTPTDGGRRQRIADLRWSTRVAWSPDGSQIAVTSGEASPADTDLYVMDADGAGLRRLTDSGGVLDAAWSPDGRQLAFTIDFSGHHEGSAIAVIRADGTGLRYLTRMHEGPDQRSAGDVSWIDGNRLVFVSGERRQGRRRVVGVHTIGVDGRNERRATYHCHLGTPADDVLRGSILGDTLRSLAGRDVVIPGPGRDDVVSGRGDDVIRARDGERDVLRCGPGHDTALADRFDVVRACERVLRR